MVNAARQRGHSAAANKLMKPGSEGYPGSDDVHYLCVVLGGSIIVQAGTKQNAIGDDKVVGHIRATVVHDPAGHVSEHCEVVES